MIKKLIQILFICHGNICRSPMAESVFAQMIERRGLTGKIFVSSAAAHTDEIGNPPHRGTVEKLRREGVPLVPHRARLLTKADCEKYDLLIGMDEYNRRDILRVAGEKYAHKVKCLLDYSDRPRAIADPWYTGNFEETYSDIVEGCTALLDALIQEKGENI